MTTLFRREALEAKRHGLQSKVLIVRPPQLSLFASFAAAFLIAIFVFACFGEFTHRAPTRGAVVPRAGVHRIYSPTPGTISQKFFENGQPVHKGDQLYTVFAERYTEQQNGVEMWITAFAKARRESVSVELNTIDTVEGSEQRSLTSTIGELQRQLSTINDQIRRQNDRVALSANAHKRYRELHLSNLTGHAAANEREIGQRQ